MSRQHQRHRTLICKSNNAKLEKSNYCLHECLLSKCDVLPRDKVRPARSMASGNTWTLLLLDTDSENFDTRLKSKANNFCVCFAAPHGCWMEWFLPNNKWLCVVRTAVPLSVHFRFFFLFCHTSPAACAYWKRRVWSLAWKNSGSTNHWISTICIRIYIWMRRWRKSSCSHYFKHFGLCAVRVWRRFRCDVWVIHWVFN